MGNTRNEKRRKRIERIKKLVRTYRIAKRVIELSFRRRNVKVAFSMILTVIIFAVVALNVGPVIIKSNVDSNSVYAHESEKESVAFDKVSGETDVTDETAETETDVTTDILAEVEYNPTMLPNQVTTEAVVVTYSDVTHRIWSAAEQAVIDKYAGTGVGKTIYLTFDDGPSENTASILETLDYYGLKATFFCVGKEDEFSASMYRAIIDGGHTLGMHSYSHDYSIVYASLDSFIADLQKLGKVIYNATGIWPKFYRFPGGSSNSKTDDIYQYINYLNENGYIYYDWNSSSEDATGATLTTIDIVNNVMKNAGGSVTVALLHDAIAKTVTAQALPLLIETLLNAGYNIQPITDDSPLVQHRTAE